MPSQSCSQSSPLPLRTHRSRWDTLSEHKAPFPEPCSLNWRQDSKPGAWLWSTDLCVSDMYGKELDSEPEGSQLRFHPQFGCAHPAIPSEICLWKAMKSVGWCKRSEGEMPQRSEAQVSWLCLLVLMPAQLEI